MTAAEKQAEFLARVERFRAALRTIEAHYGVRIEAGYGPCGEDLGVRDEKHRGLECNIGGG